MRLICPNCEAEYEVDGGQIASEGRDVQCSNCAHTWLQMPEGFGEVPAADVRNASGDPTSGAARSQAEAAAPIPKAAIKRNATDPDALNVLLEEVELEMRQRDAETASGIETQTELGLDQADFAPAPVADPVEPDETPEADLNTAELAPAEQRGEGTKRELLPDIEEINSTLASAPSYDEDGELEEGSVTVGRRGFRTGFGLGLLLAAFLLVFYAYAPALIEKFPQFEGQITGAVAVMNTLRGALETGAQSLLQMLDGLLEGFRN